MSKHMKRAFDILNAARPASGFQPETPEEMLRLHTAFSELGYAMLRDSGVSDGQARELARQILGGPAGLLLLEIGFQIFEEASDPLPVTDATPGGRHDT